MKPIRVLVVDDSAFARKVIREVLSGAEGIEVVGTARDGLDALEKIGQLHPDVLTLDLNMPDLDGLGVLKALKSLPHRPVVVVVSVSDGDSELGVAALAEGAFDVVHKPTALAMDRLYELSDELRAKVKLAARSNLPAAERSRPDGEGRVTLAPRVPARTRILLIGASTGGPQAIAQVLRALPKDFPVPIALVLHMPEGYTESFARRLDRDVDLDVMEAHGGLTLRPGLVAIGRAGMHLKLEKAGATWTTQLDLRPFGQQHCPSVDVLFNSAATAVGAGTLAVVLTGMGEDGLAGARAIRDAGGTLLTEAESSAVVYGMPRAVFEAGLATAEAPIDEMAALILHHV